MKEKSKYNGLLLLDKKPGLTSFESLGFIKKTLATGKVGHTGTLDKFASGLLIALSGYAGKLTPLFNICEKEYEAQVCFGIETDTLDPEGEVIKETDIPERESIEKALSAFRGVIQQAPPAFSAIHINGVRAHELARQGKMPEMKKRPVTIHKLELLSFEAPYAFIRVVCSSGTYIRSLARDIAIAAGSSSHLVALKRTRIGGFLLKDAVMVTDTQNTVIDALKPITPEVFKSISIPFIYINEKYINAIRHGQSLYSTLLKDIVDKLTGTIHGQVAGLFDKHNTLIAVLEQKQGKWHYANVFVK